MVTATVEDLASKELAIMDVEGLGEGPYDVATTGTKELGTVSEDQATTEVEELGIVSEDTVIPKVEELDIVFEDVAAADIDYQGSDSEAAEAAEIAELDPAGKYCHMQSVSRTKSVKLIELS